MSMRLTASVRQKRLRRDLRPLAAGGLGRAREGNAPKRAGDLPRTSNLGRTPGGRALLADPFLVNADRDGDTSSESRR